VTTLGSHVYFGPHFASSRTRPRASLQSPSFSRFVSQWRDGGRRKCGRRNWSSALRSALLWLAILRDSHYAFDVHDLNAMKYVGFRARFLAFLIDSAWLMLLLIPVLYLLFGVNYIEDVRSAFEELGAALNGQTPQASPKTPIGQDIVTWSIAVVPIILFWIFRSSSPGKMAVKAQIVDARTGGPISQKQSVIRYIGYFVSLVPLCLGFLWIAFDKRKQGWHDKLAKTLVVKEPLRTEPQVAADEIDGAFAQA